MGDGRDDSEPDIPISYTIERGAIGPAVDRSIVTEGNRMLTVAATIVAPHIDRYGNLTLKFKVHQTDKHPAHALTDVVGRTVVLACYSPSPTREQMGGAILRPERTTRASAVRERTKAQQYLRILDRMIEYPELDTDADADADTDTVV